MDNSPLLRQLKQVYKVSDKDCARLIPLFESLDVKKNEHLFRAGEIARHVYFVEQVV
jgi:CRP-like cAMP-binding protein